MCRSGRVYRTNIKTSVLKMIRPLEMPWPTFSCQIDSNYHMVNLIMNIYICLIEEYHLMILKTLVRINSSPKTSLLDMAFYLTTLITSKEVNSHNLQ